MEKLTVLHAKKVESRRWEVELSNGDVWTFERREYLDEYGSPVYKVYPPEDKELKKIKDVRRNFKEHCYYSYDNGIENLGATENSTVQKVYRFINSFYETK